MGLDIKYADNAPLFSVELPSEMKQWISVVIDTLNYDLELLYNVFRQGFLFPPATQAEIVALVGDVNNPVADGTAWYCTDSSPPNVVLKINGTLVQLNTSAFP